MSELPPEDRDEEQDSDDEWQNNDEQDETPEGISPNSSASGPVRESAGPGARSITRDPYPTLLEFEARVRGVWSLTSGMFAVVVLGLWISGFDPQRDGLAALVSPVALANFVGHVFSADAWPISVLQYALIAFAMIMAVHLGRFLSEQYRQIDIRLTRWAAEDFPAITRSPENTAGPIGRIQSQIASGREGGRVPDREALLEEFDAEFERLYAPLRHLASIAIFFGLLGTFWGLQTHANGLASAGGMGAVKDIAAAMHTAFACSIVGVLSALLLGFLSLRMYGASATLRQRLDHVLTVQLLPSLRSSDLTEPLVEALEQLHQAIQSLGNVGASVERLPDLLGELRTLLASWTSERAMTTSALDGLERAVAGLDGLNRRFDKSTQALDRAVASLVLLGATWVRQSSELTTSVATIGNKFDTTVSKVAEIAGRARDESTAALADGRDLIERTIEETVESLNEEHEEALKSLQASHAAALGHLLAKQGEVHLPLLNALAKRDEEQRKLLQSILDALKRNAGSSGRDNGRPGEQWQRGKREPGYRKPTRDEGPVGSSIPTDRRDGSDSRAPEAAPRAPRSELDTGSEAHANNDRDGDGSESERRGIGHWVRNILRLSR